MNGATGGGGNKKDIPKMSYNSYDDYGDGTGLIFKWTLAFIVACIIGSCIWFLLLPWMNYQQVAAAHQSYGYINTKQQEMINVIQDYNNLQTKIDAHPDTANYLEDLKAQQKYDVQKIEADVAMMNNQDIPTSVRSFLNEHGN